MIARVKHAVHPDEVNSVADRHRDGRDGVQIDALEILARSHAEDRCVAPLCLGVQGPIGGLVGELAVEIRVQQNALHAELPDGAVKLLEHGVGGLKVVMTLCAAEREAEPDGANGGSAVDHLLDAKLLDVGATFAVGKGIAVKPGGNALVERCVGQLVAGTLSIWPLRRSEFGPTWNKATSTRSAPRKAQAPRYCDGSHATPRPTALITAWSLASAIGRRRTWSRF